jgi:hypothetical protein
MSKPKFSWLKEPLQIYTNNLLKYAEYLIDQKATTTKNQSSLTPIVDEGNAAYIEVLDANTYTWQAPHIIKEFKLLNTALKELPYWEPININQFCPNQRM